MILDLYILDETGVPRLEDNFVNWAHWMYYADRRVALTEVEEGVTVSTMFLAQDASNGPCPVVWESMIRGGVLDDEICRCGGLRADAEAMHEATVAMARARLKHSRLADGG